jgi:hypothetical protein
MNRQIGGERAQRGLQCFVNHGEADRSTFTDRGFSWTPFRNLAGAPITALSLSHGPDSIDLVVT